MNLRSILIIAIISLFVTSCSKEPEFTDDKANFSMQINVSEKEQAPRAIYDTSERGIYHGVIASGFNQSRGKIWVNVGNNTEYTALVEMVNGDVFHYEIDPKATLEDAPTVFTFKTNQGGFILDVTNPREPKITEASLYNQEYLSSVLKSTSFRRARAITGYFLENGNPGFSGTWNLISDGASNPNGFGGQEITLSMVTWNGRSFEDTSFESYTSPFLCLNQTITPALESFVLDGIMCDNQTSLMGMSTIDWSLSFEALLYTNYTDCLPRTSGSFSLDNGQGVTRDGAIFIDIL